MQYPGNAALDVEYRKIQFVCDLTITETLANQAIDGAQDSNFFPKDSHEAPPSQILGAGTETTCLYPLD
jgi:hypothetical protein